VNAGSLYAPENYLATVDVITYEPGGLQTGTVRLVGPTQSGLDAIAFYPFNNVYVTGSSSTLINTAFPEPLQTRVVAPTGQGVPGVTVTFQIDNFEGAPGGTFPEGATFFQTTTDENGVATAPTITANGIAGIFDVRITAPIRPAMPSPFSPILWQREYRPRSPALAAPTGTGRRAPSSTPTLLHR
jgi:hypothetical protein